MILQTIFKEILGKSLAGCERIKFHSNATVKHRNSISEQGCYLLAPKPNLRAKNKLPNQILLQISTGSKRAKSCMLYFLS